MRAHWGTGITGFLPLLLAAAFTIPTHAADRVEITLPPGLHHPDDAGDESDPRGLPRLPDYLISGTESHTVLGPNLFDMLSGNKEGVLMKVRELEYKLDRYAKRPSATPEAILRHYRDHLRLISGRVESESATQLKGSYVLGGMPISVTIEVRDGGKRYFVTTGGLGAQNGTTATVSNDPKPGHTPPLQVTAPPAPAAAPPVDPRPFASGSFSMPSEPTLWPARGTRGMTVLLVGPGVHRASAVRFDASEAEIVARENARLRVRVPMLPEGNYNVTLVGENGTDPVRKMFQVLDTPRADAATVTIAPCDGRPEKYGVSIMDIEPRSARAGQTIKLYGRSIDDVTHITFTVAQDAVDPRITAVNPDLIGIDFGASGKPRSAPRWLDTLSANIGSSYGTRPSQPGECDVGNLSGYAAVKHTADGEMIVCVPPLAMSGPIGVWRPDGKTGDVCDTSDIPVQIDRTTRSRRQTE